MGEELEYRPDTARLALGVVPSDGAKGLVLGQAKHVYLENRCHCGHCTRARPGRAGGEADRMVELSEWHLAEPTLVARICAPALRIGNGTRTDQGTRALANLATIIETRRERAVSPWPYLAEVIRQRRKGCPAPALPADVGLAVCSP